MRALAIVPARGGSKRLPRKNVADFLGRPIIAWSIAAARDSDCFDRVLVSTEDDEIAAVARRFGADVVARPEPLASDAATVVEVCLDALEAEEAAGRRYDLFCCLYATSPLRDADDVRAVMALVDPGRCDFAMAVTRFDLPPYRALRMSEAGGLVPMWPELVARKSQEIGELVVNNGSTYAASVAAFREHRTFTGPGARGYLMPRERSTDIDVAEDLEEALVRAQRIGFPGSARPS